jgi:hypothetical protein
MVNERTDAPHPKNKARQIVAGAGKNILDYVIRRFDASLAGLKKLAWLDLRRKAA